MLRLRPSGKSGVGGICYDAQGRVLSWFGAEVPPSFLKVLQSCFGAERATVIFELEALAVAVALELFANLLSRRNIVMYTDNSGVHGAFVKCWSENEVGSALAFLAAKREFDLQAFFYYDRVPSPSNPADAPSRFACGLPCKIRAECTADTLEKTLKQLSMFRNCVMLRCGLWLFRSWCKSFLSVPAGTRSETWPRRPRAGF